MNNIKIPTVPAHVNPRKRIDWLSYALNKFCMLPWINLNTNPNGNIKLCCNIQEDIFVSNESKAFNLGYDDIDTIWNNNYMSNVRQLHRQNMGSEDCKNCYSIEKITGHSPRMGQNVMWLQVKEKDEELSNYLQQISNENPKLLAEQLPISLELRLGNQCNLRCITCWGMSSSLIQTDRLDILEKGHLKKYNLEWLDSKWKQETEIVEKSELNEWHDTEIFYNNIKKIAPKLRRLYTTGGEPTIIKANYRILEMLLESGNKTCSVEFTSNMTTWNPKFYDALSQFENVEIQMSLDGVNETAEFIRYGCDFNIVKENVARAFELASKNPKWRLKSYSVLQALNYRELPKVWELLSDLALKYNKHMDWWPITLNSPPHLSLSAIPLEERIAYVPFILEEAKKYSNSEKSFCLSEGTVTTYTDSIKNNEYNKDLHEKFLNYLTFIKDYRKNHAK